MSRAKSTSAEGVKQTPMLKQYSEQKALYPDCILFFRLGDFYEMFFEDAELAAAELDLALTSRSKGEDGYPMCGVPYFSAGNYISKLVERGHKVAVCDQVEDPKLARGIVRREVTRVVSPGMITDPDDLDAAQSNYLAGLEVGEEGGFGFAFLDVSTADFRATAVPDLEGLLDELTRVRPRELLIPIRLEGTELHEAIQARFRGLFLKFTDLEAEREVLGLRHFTEQLGFAPGSARPLEVEAASRVFAYADASLPGSLVHVRRLVPYETADHLIIDEVSRQNLELTHTLMEGRRQGSLLGVLDRTRTPMGARCLARWLLFPLVRVEAIARRADAVEQLVNEAVQRGDVREALAGMRDLERLLSRASVGQATPRDLGALREALLRLPRWAGAVSADGEARPLLQLLGPLDPLADLGAELDRVLVDEPPVDLAEGGAVRPGADPRLSELCRLTDDGRALIAELEGRERQSTGIGSLKVRYNRVFGYYIEVTRPNLHLVPGHYRRKQTTANAERFDTDELKRLEERLLSAQEERVSLERELLGELVRRLQAEAERILQTAEQVAVSDTLASLAEVAAQGDYRRPRVDDSFRIDLGDSRHPVVERLMADEHFVPNDIALDCEAEQLLVITGPNMAGKSTVIRQVALCAILAQMGSFVPAARAEIGVVDRIFTRIGAADNLARGQSTFMVEMIETAHILHHATRRSLLILDEIGRGTSTFDGLSIAWAVAEFIHDRIGARTLFATHYHQLAELAKAKPRTTNLTIAVREVDGRVVFLRRLVRGITNRSYGIQVSRLAGLPAEVVARAEEVLRNLEQGDVDEIGAPRLLCSADRGRKGLQLQLFAPGKPPSEVEEAIRGIDIDRLTPLEALGLLARYKEMLG